MSKLKRKSICQRHVKGELPGTRGTVSHVDDDSVINNHSEGDAAARTSTTEKETKCQPERRTAGRVTVRCVVVGGGGVITKLSELFAAININWPFSSINAFIQSFHMIARKTYAY